ncbi:hypothetical protein C923_05557 [Plasmodium falciparum UGT5.1]|uniref:Phospholipid/glycerol acyltransferase domain-containing protein n=1 Tax=Plasmodium falciparum UGT5.1 TaxID=1237627 RepID=W7J484_PLAFA|nr:hypothetical protein C923_05557 [Plasmodium falciparum UGT5.1]
MEIDVKKKYKHSNILIRLILTIYIYIVMFLTLSFSLICQLSSLVIFFPLFLYSKKAKLYILGLCIQFGAYLLCSFINPFWKLVIIRKSKKKYEPTNTILFINHLSSVDPWVVNATTFPWPIKFVFKSSLLKIPIGGQALYFSGSIPLHFTKDKGGWGVKQGEVQKIMNICKEYQDMNIPLAIFPEGTRSVQGHLQLFKSGFFRFAIENNCEILPCALHGTNKVWPLKSSLFDKGTIYFSFGEPFKPTPGMTYEQLRDKTRMIMYEMIKEFPDYDPEVDTLAKEFSQARGHGF